MFRDLPVMLVSAATGLGYGILLACAGFLSAGFGHGTYVLIGLSSAPFGLTEDVLVALIGAPVLWCTVGFLAGGAGHWVWRTLCLIALAGHYGSLYRVLNKPSPFADWEFVPKAQQVFRIGVAIYEGGQVALWVLIIYQLWRRRADRHHRDGLV
jgi:hypothetical protein